MAREGAHSGVDQPLRKRTPSSASFCRLGMAIAPPYGDNSHAETSSAKTSMMFGARTVSSARPEAAPASKTAADQERKQRRRLMIGADGRILSRAARGAPAILPKRSRITPRRTSSSPTRGQRNHGLPGQPHFQSSPTLGLIEELWRSARPRLCDSPQGSEGFPQRSVPPPGNTISPEPSMFRKLSECNAGHDP